MRMPKKHIITIAGKPGSGKSTTANKVAELLTFTRFSSGDLMREIAHGRGITLEEVNKLAENEPSIDHEVDTSLKRLGENDRIVIDSRLAFHWIPQSFKVYLDLDLDLAAARIFRDMNKQRVMSGEDAATVHEVLIQLHDRLASERRRYKTLYGIDPYDTSHFDLVIDTAQNNPYTVALKIFDAFNIWIKKEE